MSEPALDTPAPNGPARAVRALTVAVTVDAVGSGMYVPFSLVFFRHVTGLPLPTIGLVLTVTGPSSGSRSGGWPGGRPGARGPPRAGLWCRGSRSRSSP
ncbi:MAG TPA: hypothetical protein VGX23_04100 [Actinocrinis sp.]|nr:hypothetical protein [Actinocrinis sp.]